jgi:glutamyl-tRNA reductase
MSHLIIVHRAFQGGDEQKVLQPMANSTSHVWQTCRRQIIFFDEFEFQNFVPTINDQIFLGLDAEEFLIHVLCGLKSPLVGETEVFGQFKNWWQNWSDCSLKQKIAARVQQIFSVVKKVREEALYGLGSQSYGSLLRKKLNDNELLNSKNNRIDFIGAGQLTEEMLPWVAKFAECRLWVRNPEKHALKSAFKQTTLLDTQTINMVSDLVVIAAPLTQSEVLNFLSERGSLHDKIIFDFRHDSVDFQHADLFARYFNLNEFVTEVEFFKNQIQGQIVKANGLINRWKQDELNRAQVRPFGWDDL